MTDFKPKEKGKTTMNKFVNAHTKTGFVPSTDLEGKALYLEETLMKMQDFLLSLKRKRGWMKRNNKDTKSIDKKIQSVSEGLQEVYQKCTVIWDDIVKEG